MSIFVLNLATLLGLGLGVDYSLLLTSRFREELALRPAGPDRVSDAVRVTVATAGRAVFFSGLTVLLGLLGLILFEFMILRSVGIAGAIVVGLAVASALTLLPAVLTILGDRVDRFAIRHVSTASPTPTARGRGSPGGSCATRSRSSSRRSGCCSSSARRSCTSGSTRPTPRSCRPRSRHAPPSTGSRPSSAKASSPPSCSPSGRPATPPTRRTWAPCTTTRADSPRTRGSSASTASSTSTRGCTLEQYRLLYGDPNGPRDRYVAEGLAATTRGDVTAFTMYTPYGPNRDEGRALVRRPARPGGPLGPPPGADGPRRRWRRGRHRRRRPRRRGLPADAAVHRRHDLSSCCSSCCDRSCCRPRRWS